MQYGILVSFILFLIMFSYSVVVNKKVGDLSRKNGAFDTTNERFIDNRGMVSEYFHTTYEKSEEQRNIETIEAALIRTCRAVSTIAHANNCDEWSKASYVWKFVGNIGETSSLDDVETEETSDNFTCDTQDKFGRGLFQASLPSSFIVGQNYLYNLENVTDENTDPCGYTNIVSR